MPHFDFRKSSRSSGNGECVEVALNRPGVVAVRDSKDPDGPILRLAPGAWVSFASHLHQRFHGES
ncbi:DUF397 domain-containing protein [Streptomyces sp. NPDC005551]|uniref:DUF397 domain-containing protein n=1 Tax=unclassified Streptomyces TaxID=2593676 RepID=UPI0033EE25DD